MELIPQGGCMHTVEIAGHCYAYKNITQLNELIYKRLETLAKEDAHYTERMWRTRSEKKAIAKYLGVPISTPEPRLSENALQTSTEAVIR